MSTSAKKVDPPSDPDPTPVSSADSVPEIQGAARNEQKKMAKAYGRSKTILAGNTETQQNSAKKTVLGG